MTRVIVLLEGGSFLQVFFPTREEASAYIAHWVKTLKDRIETGNPALLDTWLMQNSFPSDQPQSAMLANRVIAMYIPSGEPSAQERAAVAMEKIAKDHGHGEEWKDE